MVIPNFVAAALRNEPVTVYGDGKQQRSFGYVGEVAEALTRLMGCEAAVGKVVNVGNDQEISIEDLARETIKRCKSASKMVYIPYSEAYAEGFEDTRRRVPDLSRLESLIQFRPRMPIGDILDRVIASRRGTGAASPETSH
jgi:UDP-glucose 4-epimerase